ncbi:MAG TPA: carboxypeptidase M32 [Thermoanaerobaculia bacterium]|nr:carboxypeptidase M32 [Thermoanaerobaculia bacterium]
MAEAAPAPCRHPAFTELERRWTEIRHLESVAALLSWDQETMMPAGATAARSAQTATVAATVHDRLTAEELQRVIEEAEVAAAEPLQRAAVAEARRLTRRALAIPRRLAGELAAAAALGTEAWQRARAEDRFAPFRPALQRLVELKWEQATLLSSGSGPDGDPYDALLDEHEPGARAADLDRLFASLEPELVALGRALPVATPPAPPAASARYPLAAQREAGVRVARALGFDESRGRIDASAHPFCVGLDPTDVRLTWRAEPDDFRPALLGCLHEAGHALYEQGLPPALAHGPLGGAASLGVHESQSRLWENRVGRSRGFCRWLFTWLPELLPALPCADPDELWRHLHELRRGPIRVDADEVTYDLHVLTRYRLEKALLSSQLEVADLPDAWNEEYRGLLGLTPTSDRTGVLQDIHWAVGLFGYFPTYTLGNLAAHQLFEAAVAKLGDLDADFERGDFAPLLGWLRDHVHSLAATLPPRELIRRATGRPLETDPFLRHVRGLVGLQAPSPAAARAPGAGGGPRR